MLPQPCPHGIFYNPWADKSLLSTLLPGYQVRLKQLACPPTGGEATQDIIATSVTKCNQALLSLDPATPPHLPHTYTQVPQMVACGGN